MTSIERIPSVIGCCFSLVLIVNFSWHSIRYGTTYLHRYLRCLWQADSPPLSCTASWGLMPSTPYLSSCLTAANRFWNLLRVSATGNPASTVTTSTVTTSTVATSAVATSAAATSAAATSAAATSAAATSAAACHYASSMNQFTVC